MLDDYKSVQPGLYDLFVNVIKNDKLSHAYLIDSNNNCNCLNIVLGIVKAIICDNNYSNKNKCNNCIICKRIDDGNYPEVKIIKPEGNFIKKEQIIELQTDFSKISLEGEKRIYIILECEKMNTSTSNSILKFLEEPQQNIIAFLLTNNINKVLSTIKSRCQLLKLRENNEIYDTTIERIASKISNNSIEYELFVGTQSGKKLLEETIKYLKFYESNGLSTIIYNDKLLDFKKKKKEEISIIFDILIYFYYDVLCCKNNMNIINFIDYISFVKEACMKNSIKKILVKLQVLIEYKELIKNNINTNLMFDDMIIKFEDCD